MADNGQLVDHSLRLADLLSKFGQAQLVSARHVPHFVFEAGLQRAVVIQVLLGDLQLVIDLIGSQCPALQLTLQFTGRDGWSIRAAWRQLREDRNLVVLHDTPARILH